jgi:hypothetical protein
MSRLGQAVRAALFAGVVLAIWTFALPALAEPAALCDDRGATVLAGPPALEAPDIAVERARVGTSCEGEDRFLGAAFVPGQRSSAPVPPTAEPFAPTQPQVLTPPSGQVLPVATVVALPHDGVRSRVERPPRV